MEHEQHVLEALARAPRWHVVHWGTAETSTLLCLWVGGYETLVPLDGEYLTYRGIRRPVSDGQLAHVLRQIQHEQDAAALAVAQAQEVQRWLTSEWEVDPGEGVVGTWRFPRGGTIQWVRNDGLHVEASEGGPYRQPMPDPLVEVLVDLGWRAPDHRFRNCWLQPTPQTHAEAAAICTLTPMAAFGYTEPPATWRSQAQAEPDVL